MQKEGSTFSPGHLQGEKVTDSRTGEDLAMLLLVKVNTAGLVG